MKILWSKFKFFVYSIFHRVSRFQNWEVDTEIVLKATKKKMIIAGNLIQKSGKIIIEGDKE